jgi:hypothetical protein
VTLFGADQAVIGNPAYDRVANVLILNVSNVATFATDLDFPKKTKTGISEASGNLRARLKGLRRRWLLSISFRAPMPSARPVTIP